MKSIGLETQILFTILENILGRSLKKEEVSVIKKCIDAMLNSKTKDIQLRLQKANNEVMSLTHKLIFK